jgi:hypothetical protein
MCWTTRDLAYLRQNERVAKAKSDITDETRKIMRQWLWADYMLYDHFKAKMDERLRDYDIAQMLARLKRLNRANEWLRKECVKGRVIDIFPR